MNKRLANILGWYGAIALLIGYTMISFGWLDSRGLVYQSIVVTSTVGLTIVSMSKRLYQTALLNAVAAIIGLVAIGSIVLK